MEPPLDAPHRPPDDRRSEPHYARRTPVQNVVALACLGGFSISILLLVAGLANAWGFSLGFSLGVRGPAIATALLGVALWTLRSRR